MSNIVKNKDDLLFLSDILKYIKCNKVSKSFIENELSKLLPNYQDNLIKLCVNDRGNVYPCFLPKYREIMLYINKIEDWVNVNSNAFFNQYNGSDLDLFKGYMFIYLFTHEVEHSYQFLMGENLIDSPSFFLFTRNYVRYKKIYWHTYIRMI